MTRIVRIDVLPDVAGHWSVTRDRVVDGEFKDRDKALEYAEASADRARRAGQAVRVEIHEALEGF